MVILIIGFQILKLFLCGIWNLRREKHYPLGSSDLVLHGSINQCVWSMAEMLWQHIHEILFIHLFILTGILCYL